MTRSTVSQCVPPLLPRVTLRHGCRDLLMDALRVAAHRLALADQSLTEQYPVLYPNAKLMALSLLLYRLIHIASFFSIINKSASHYHTLTMSPSLSQPV